MNRNSGGVAAWADRAIQEQSGDLIDLASDLVRIPSENPPGDTRDVCDFCEDWLTRRGIAVRRLSADPTMPNVVARVTGARPGRRLVLNGHMDTYPAGDPSPWRLPPYEGRVVDGRLFGRGAADMKAGVAAGLLMTALAAENQDQFAGELVLTLVSDEETMGERGTAYLLAQAPETRGDALLSPETTGLDMMCFGQKGLYWVRLTSRGKGAHGAFIHRGKSAVDALMAALADLRCRLETLGPSFPPELEHYVDAAREDPRGLLTSKDLEILRIVTVNVGKIYGGEKINLVAQSCEAEVDIRLPPGVFIERVRAALKDFLLDHSDVKMEELRSHDPTVSEPDSPLFRILQGEVRSVTGREPLLALRIGATDARLFRAVGVPSATYGPTGHNVGGPNESVVLDELVQVARVLARTAFSFLCGRSP
ncbi:MAG: ArgE/DapE family deacylase [Nitrospinota bacterium]